MTPKKKVDAPHLTYRAPQHKRDLHPIIRSAADGELPDWAEAGKSRRAHMARVAVLMKEWSRQMGLRKVDRIRWVAVGYLHDALRDARPNTLRPLLSPAFRDAPGNLLHGPAAAVYLERCGVADYEVLHAIRYHTVGHPSLTTLGRALYAADFLEPGRRLRPNFRAKLRQRMPGDLNPVVQEILGARIEHLVDRESAMRPETVNFWNALVGGKLR